MIGIFTLVISIIAVIVSVTTLLIQNFTIRKQYEPILDIVLGDYYEDKYIKLENNGCGPATICESKFRIENTCKSSPKLAYNEYLQKKGKAPIKDSDWETFIDNIEGRTIGAEKEKTIIYLKSKDKDLNEQFLRVFSKMEIEIQYKDIYNRKKTIKRTCDFFSRNDIVK